MIPRTLSECFRKAAAGAALLTLVLLGMAGSRTPAADAQTPPNLLQGSCVVACTIELSFDTLSFPALGDCDYTGTFCNWSQVYASLSGNTTSGQDGQRIRNLGFWGNPMGCNKGWTWDGAGSCARDVFVNQTNYFANTEMCASSTKLTCEGAFVKNNNKIRLTVKPGEQITAFIHVKDYDSLNDDDLVCMTAKVLGPFTAAQLATLNQSFSMATSFNGDGACTVGFSLRRVS